jgi:hypothetical protein
MRRTCCAHPRCANGADDGERCIDTAPVREVRRPRRWLGSASTATTSYPAVELRRHDASDAEPGGFGPACLASICSFTILAMSSAATSPTRSFGRSAPGSTTMTYAAPARPDHRPAGRSAAFRTRPPRRARASRFSTSGRSDFWFIADRALRAHGRALEVTHDSPSTITAPITPATSPDKVRARTSSGTRSNAEM